MSSATASITVHVNDQSVTVSTGCTVAGLIAQLDLRGGPVAVEHNQLIVPLARHHDTVLHEGDRLEVVSLTGGG